MEGMPLAVASAGIRFSGAWRCVTIRCLQARRSWLTAAPVM
jgi:hypothetical protein